MALSEKPILIRGRRAFFFLQDLVESVLEVHDDAIWERLFKDVWIVSISQVL